MKLQPEERTRRAAIYLGLILTVVLILNQGLQFYINATQTFQASVVNNEEALSLEVHTDTNRPRNLVSWVNSWTVSGVERTQTTLGVSITVTGSNVATGAEVDYIIKAVDHADSAHNHKTLEKYTQSITVGGSTLTDDVIKDIGQHMTDMGISTTATHTIDYYIWVEARTTGTVSGETLTATIAETLFDSITYTYSPDIIEATLYSDKTAFIIAGDSRNFGNQDTMSLRSTSSYHYPFIEWSIGTLPDQATIQTAEIKLYKDYESHAGRIVYIRRLTETFNELQVTWTTFYSQGNPDYTEINQVTTTWQANGWNTYTVTDQFDDAYNNGAGTFYGCYLSSETGATVRVASYYTEDRGVAYKPQLVVTYQAYQGSWYPLPPLSVVELPVTLDVVAVLAVGAAVAFIVQTKRRRNERWRK